MPDPLPAPVVVTDHPSDMSRRHFLTTAASLSAGLYGTTSWNYHPLRAAQPTAPASNKSLAAEPLSFFVVGDTHYLAHKEATERLDPASAETTTGLINTLNKLAGTPLPENLGGGTVLAPRGVIHAGDIIDTGDKTGGPHKKMQITEWNRYVADYGLTGQEGRLKYPVYEVFGNHDSPHGEGLVLEQIALRNTKRPAVTHLSKNSLHYSWDWGPVHFINLGIIVGHTADAPRKSRYAAKESLDFLIDDLATKVAKTGKPVVITHHVDIARYSGTCEPQAPATGKEWDPCDVAAYHHALKNYNIAAIFYGHTHARNIYRWDGTTAKSTTGIPVFNVDNSSHFSSKEQAFFYVQLTPQELIVREYKTPGRWATADWTPQLWKVPLTVPPQTGY